MPLLVAVVPVRGTFWSGLVGSAAMRYVIDGDRMLVVSVRLRVELDGDTWMPGEPVEEARELFVDSVPQRGDALPIKGWADFFIDSDSLLLFRDRSIMVVAGDTLVPPTGRRIADGAPLAEERVFLISRDLEALQEARPEHRAPGIGSGARLGWEIGGTRAAEGTIAFDVAARADFTDGRREFMPMSLDTISVSPAKGTAELVYRGLVADPPGGAPVDRIVLGITPPSVSDDERSTMLSAGLSRCFFANAASIDDCVTGKRPPPVDADELTAARMGSWDEGPGEPSLLPEEFNAIVSEMARRPRSEVLAEHGLDEIAWSREEWAVADKIASLSTGAAGYADAADDADPELDPEAARWIAAVTPKASGVALPNLDAYARLTAHMLTRDPSKVLAEAKLTVGEFIAIEQRMNEHFDTDPRASEQFDELLRKYEGEAAEAGERDSATLVEGD